MPAAIYDEHFLDSLFNRSIGLLLIDDQRLHASEQLK